MVYKITLLLFLNILISSNPQYLRAQEVLQDHRAKIYQSYVSGQMKDWKVIIEEMAEKKSSLEKKEALALIGYFYGYIGWFMEEGEETQAKRQLQIAEKYLEHLLEIYPELPDLYAFRGAYMGIRIMMSGIRAPILGPKSIKSIDYALVLGPDSPQGWIEKGNSLCNTPAMFGGSREEAIQAYLKGIWLMEQDPETNQDNWLYLNALLILGKTYEATDNSKMARETYQKILELEPRFMRAKKNLDAIDFP